MTENISVSSKGMLIIDTNPIIPEPIKEEAPASEPEEVNEPNQSPEGKPVTANDVGERSAFQPPHYAPVLTNPGSIISFIAAFLCFLTACGALFLPLLSGYVDGKVYEKGFSVFSLVKDEVSIVKDFIEHPYKPDFNGVILLICAVFAVAVLIVALIELIFNLIFVIKRTNISCQGIGAIVSMAMSVLALYLVTNGSAVYGEDGFSGFSFGIGSFLLIGALFLSAIVSEILLDSYTKPSKTVLIRKIVLLVLSIISSAAIFVALGTGLGEEIVGIKTVSNIQLLFVANSADPGYLFMLLLLYLVVSFIFGSALERLGKRYSTNYGKQIFHRFGVFSFSELDIINAGAPIIITNFVMTVLLFVNNMLITIESNKHFGQYVIPQVLIISLIITFVCLIGLIICDAVVKESENHH